jgi:hypothetical protein
MVHASQDWYDEADAKFTGVRVFGFEAALEANAKREGTAGCYYFKPPEEPLEEHVVRPVEGFIRYGATIVGCAVQFVYNFGAREIILCGADMSGDAYWDGTSNVHPHHGETWGAAGRLSPLIRWLIEKKNVAVSSLSPTKLDVPRYRARAPAER